VSAICNQTEKDKESKKKDGRHKKIRENSRVQEAIQYGSEHLNKHLFSKKSCCDFIWYFLNV